ncbi:glycosyltransferase family 2 protein [Clostridium sp. Sa3CVN1]|uniref:Glycosyltransferase family 2 protein n=1 Tax=Clostridium cibarium TaxID=2762247 RepID=A0ABR8PW84_9CLOT|nr:glycosyltransferase family 2 protein [Clostridium cibarium]
MEMEPLISIIMPTYNRAKIIKRAINSVLNQTYDNWELIIIDDYGNDNTKDLIKDIYKDENRIKFILNKRKKGIAGARNTGIMESNGQYIAFLDSDDEWISSHLKDLLTSMMEEKIHLGFALWKEGKEENFIGIDENNFYKELFKKSVKELDSVDKEKYTIYQKDFFEFTMKTYFYCYHINTMIIKKRILDELGLFNENLGTSEDNEFLFRILSKTAFILYKDYHYKYYQSEDSVYAFIDREKITKDEILSNSVTIDKLTKLGLDKIVVRKISLKLIKELPFIKDKKECRDIIEDAIYSKLLTLGYINLEANRKNAIKFLGQAFCHKPNLVPLKMIFECIFDRKNKFNSLSKEQLNLW